MSQLENTSGWCSPVRCCAGSRAAPSSAPPPTWCWRSAGLAVSRQRLEGSRSNSVLHSTEAEDTADSIYTVYTS